ncbi:hypothetical protein [Brevundimonas lenta]|uniref:Protein ImuA n=1 Tax=Brevundimonas lenta TaxID=424796 RepID=A0A7W6JD29_9CAUL|nr:hypothetical protein [Brevundimonas lenta]MBB4081931.1 protein ImuA [Brevundimonas lenta]
MTAAPAPFQDRFPEAAAPLEEACAPGPRDMAATMLFALSRRRGDDARPVLMTAPRAWLGEYGRPYGPGLPGTAFILAPTATLAEALWVLEQALRSGAVSVALGAVDGATLTQTRRLEFAAKQGKAVGLILSRDLDGLSAARRRWRVSTQASARDFEDGKAPGAARLLAELTRSRSERPGAWLLEQDDETHRLRLADRLADLGPASIAGAGAPSGLAA